jgi:hypothetical protein
VLATGIGVTATLAAALAMLNSNAELMADSEAYLVAEPVPLGPRGGYWPKFDSWMGFSRIFDNVWSGRRHALVGPVQVDRFSRPTFLHRRPRQAQVADARHCAASPATRSTTPTPSLVPSTTAGCSSKARSMWLPR